LTVLIALAVACVVLFGLLLPSGRRGNRESGPIVWRGGRRELTEDAAAKMVLDRLRDRE
jgi:hypothetical protein